jgi:nitrite reductase (NO-forming)
MARDLIPLERGRRPSISRTVDRRITIGGLLLSAAYLGAAVATMTLPEPTRYGLWLPVHLALAGGAGTAVAAVLPYFMTALSVAQPRHPVVRGGAIALIAGGALAATVGVVGGVPALGVGGALAYLAGLVAISIAAFRPLRGANHPRLRLVRLAYAAAIGQVLVGVSLVGLMLAGVAPIVAHWGLLKPAHAWLNVFGFLAVIVAATLIHLAPTVVGGRIRPRRSASVALVGLIVGAPLIALGFALGSDAVARLGALVEVVGAVALGTHALVVWRDRAGWTTDGDWHRLTSWSLTAAPIWLLVAAVLAGAPILASGAVPGAWSLGTIAAPLAVGGVIQALLGSWSHLLPAIGPGSATAHRRQRERLGRAATLRLVALNLGTALVVLGGVAALSPLRLAGAILVGGTIAGSIAIFVIAFWLDHAEPPANASLRIGRAG